MPKTNFSNGTVVTPEYLNTMYKTNGGHTHDGADADGHAPKINLRLHVDDTLPFNKVSAHTHDGISAPRIDLSQHVTGVLKQENLPNSSLLTPDDAVQHVSNRIFDVGCMDSLSSRPFHQIDAPTPYPPGASHISTLSFTIASRGIPMPPQSTLCLVSSSWSKEHLGLNSEGNTSATLTDPTLVISRVWDGPISIPLSSVVYSSPLPLVYNGYSDTRFFAVRLRVMGTIRWIPAGSVFGFIPSTDGHWSAEDATVSMYARLLIVPGKVGGTEVPEWGNSTAEPEDPHSSWWEWTANNRANT